MYTEQRARGPCTSQHQDKMAKSSLLVVEKRGDSSLLPAFLGSKNWLYGFILLRSHANVSFITPILSRLFCYIWESDFVYVQTWWPLASTKSSDHLF